MNAHLPLWEYADERLNPQEQQNDNSVAKNSAIDRWDKIFRENRIPQTAFAYIAAVANDSDLPLLDALAIQLEGSRVSIEIMGLRDYVAGNPNTLATLAAQRYSVSSWEEEAVLAVIDHLDPGVLEQLITGHHKSDKIRLSALEIAARDGYLTVEVLRKVLATEDSVRNFNVITG